MGLRPRKSILWFDVPFVVGIWLLRALLYLWHFTLEEGVDSGYVGLMM